MDRRRSSHRLPDEATRSNLTPARLDLDGSALPTRRVPNRSKLSFCRFRLVAPCSTMGSTLRNVTGERSTVELRVVGGTGIRAHSSRKSSRRYPAPETARRTILYIGADPDCRVVLSRIVRRLDHVHLVVTQTGRHGRLLAVSCTPHRNCPRCPTTRMRRLQPAEPPRPLGFHCRHSAGDRVGKRRREDEVHPRRSSGMDDEASEDLRGRAYDDGSPRADFPLVGPGIVDTSRARVSRRVWREEDPVGTVPMTDSPSISNLISTWDMSVAGVLNGRSTLPAHLDAWLASLRHSYPQASATASLPEPFLGRLDRRPAAVFLAATAGRLMSGPMVDPTFSP